MKLEDYKAWLLQHGEIKEEYERPYNPQCDPPEYENGSYFLSLCGTALCRLRSWRCNRLSLL